MKSPLALALIALAALALPSSVVAAQPRELVGALHEHSGYSDGWPGSRPMDYYLSARDRNDLHFLGSGEHETNLAVPFVANEECVTNPGPCAIADPVNPMDSFRKWPAMQEQAQAATDPSKDFTGFRGFEWSSDRQGHIDVYFSREYTQSTIDGSAVTVDAFYEWLVRPSTLGGGSDGLATFNHPGDKSLCGLTDGCGPEDDPAFNWDDFRYVPEADPQMVGIEVFNGDRDYGSPPGHNAPPEGWYARALDRGWHVGAVGAEDKGHDRSDDWGAPAHAKTVLRAAENTPAGIKEAMRRRSFYAVQDNALRLAFTVDGAPMGARLRRRPGRELEIKAKRTAGAPVMLELVTSGGEVVESGQDELVLDRAAAADERWYFVRASRGEKNVGYSSPVWVEPAAAQGEWLAGDLHVHSCYSHDAYCPGTDEPIEYEPGDDPGHLQEELEDHASENGTDVYTYGVPVGERFREAALRGLDYSAISDHNDIRSVDDSGFGAAGVIGVPGYENSIEGHAQMLGATRIYDSSDRSAAAVNEMAGRLREDGGLFQANHPGYRIESAFTGCDTAPLHWRYGFDVRPDSIEVWNPTSPIVEAERYLDCWLDRGVRMPLTGGSDGHWASTQAIGSGNPTTWVLARERSREGILEALKEGRTSISDTAPANGGAPLLLEGDADGDGSYEVAVGDAVPPGTAMRVRSGSPTATGVVRIRANGNTLLEESLPAGGEVTFEAPAGPGWVRATLRAPVSESETAPGCEPSEASVSLCAYDQSMLGMTSPIYLIPRQAPDPGAGGTPNPAGRPGSGTPGAGYALPRARRLGRLHVRLTTARRRSRRVLRRHPVIGFRARCSRRCRVSAFVRSTGRRARRLGAKTTSLPASRTRRVRVRLGRRAVRAALRERPMRAVLLRVRFSDREGHSRVARRRISILR